MVRDIELHNREQYAVSWQKTREACILRIQKTANADYIPEIEVSEFKSLDLKDLPLELTVLDSLKISRSVHELLIINGLERGKLGRALEGDNPGTKIYQKRAS